MAKTWVVVAESCRAKIYQQDTPLGPLTELEGLSHPEARLHEQELTSDLPGRTFDRKGQGNHALGSSSSAKDQEVLLFSKELAQEIESARLANKFEQLILIAPPEFLGLLRKQLNSVTHTLISKEIHKNMVKHSADEIRGLLSH